MEDETIYYRELAKGMEDKLFFLDYIEADAIIDFGCGDGQVSEAIIKCGGNHVIGYDKNKEALPDSTNKIIYSDDWDMIKKMADANDSVAIYFSSIFHELLSFGEMGGVIDKLHEVSPDYIIIRDMYITDEHKMEPVLESDIMEVMDMVNLRLVNDFVCKHGPLMSKGNLIHFMMKHRFAYNWDYEVKENYIALTDSDVEFWESLGEVVYKDHYPLSYYQEVFDIRYNYKLDTPTHLKLIVET